MTSVFLRKSAWARDINYVVIGLLYSRWRVVTYELPIFTFQVKIVIFFYRSCTFSYSISCDWVIIEYFSNTPIVFILSFSFLECGRSRTIIIEAEATIQYDTGCFYIPQLYPQFSLSLPTKKKTITKVIPILILRK